MPIPAILAIIGAVIFGVGMITFEVRTLRRRKRNMKHWENDEPLEKAGDWD
ncbi:MAG TPA: hypothetical protein VHJ20_16355 [Polyangia bacterium]|nr:hypothetical protein [Polyangia bacterium]